MVPCCVDPPNLPVFASAPVEALSGNEGRGYRVQFFQGTPPLACLAPEKDADPECEVQAEHHGPQERNLDSSKRLLGSRWSYDNSPDGRMNGKNPATDSTYSR